MASKVVATRTSVSCETGFHHMPQLHVVFGIREDEHMRGWSKKAWLIKPPIV